nr:unnamed protein product [Digitaria exilis]
MAFSGGLAVSMLLLLTQLASCAMPCVEQEKASLLEFLSDLTRDGGLAVAGLEGHISPALGDLARLQRLNLSYNSLSGGLPLWQLVSSSQVVDVSFNRLNGELGELPSSVTHGHPLQFNKFSGNIPSALGNCSMLKVLMLGHNNLSSTIPDELFNSSTSLERLSFRNAGLRGTLDSAHVTKLTDLVALDLGENSFTSKIPESIGQLKRLEELLLDNNKMSGELPPGVQV